MARMTIGFTCVEEHVSLGVIERRLAQAGFTNPVAVLSAHGEHGLTLDSPEASVDDGRPATTA